MIKIYSLILVFTLTWTLLGAQDCNLIGIDIVDEGDINVCGGLSVRLEIEPILSGSPIGQEYPYFITNSGSGSCIRQTLPFDIDDDGIENILILFEQINSCEPVTKDLFITVTCPETDDTLILDQYLTTVNLYPNLSSNYIAPGCSPGENGSINWVSQSGEICTETFIGVPGVVGECDGINGEIFYSTILYEGTPCEIVIDNSHIIDCNTGTLGCTDPNACNYNPAATCDDGTCVTQDPCCPNPIVSSFPSFLCSGVNTICITFDDDPMFSIIGGLFDSTAFITTIPFPTFPGGNNICWEVSYSNTSCEPIESSLQLLYTCSAPNSIPIVISLDPVLYPDPSLFLYEFDYTYEECAPFPIIVGSGVCDGNLFVDVVEPNNNCRNPEDGLYIPMVTPPFPLPGVENCFSDKLIDTILIAPCPSEADNGILTIKKN